MIILKIKPIAQVITALSLIVTANAKAQDNTARLQQIMQEGHVPGMSLTWIKKGKVAEQYKLGVQNAESGIPVNDSTVFSACSLSKSVFSYAVFKLQEAGKLDLDKPLYQYEAYSDIAHDDRYKQVTARMVLSHSSGLPNWRNGQLNFKFNPGEKFSYSGEGYVWLSKTVEKITGMGIEAYMQQAILKPLGMKHSSYVGQPSFEKNYAWPHTDISRSNTKKFSDKPNMAWSLETTAADFGKLIMAMLNDKKFVAWFQLQTGMTVKPNFSWTMGFGLEQTAAGKNIWQWGDNGTYKAFFMANITKQEGLVYFTNSANGLNIVRDVVQLYLGHEHPGMDWLDADSASAPFLQTFFRSLQMPEEEAIKPWLDTQGKLDTTKFRQDHITYISNRLMELGHPDKAISFLLLNLQRPAPSVATYKTLGEAYLKTGDKPHAIETFKKAYETEKNEPITLLIDRLQGVEEKADSTQKDITFKQTGYENARYVSLAGSFNGWNNVIQPMTWKEGAWQVTIPLKKGVYEYKFVVDGIYIPDAANPTMNRESLNSILIVE